MNWRDYGVACTTMLGLVVGCGGSSKTETGTQSGAGTGGMSGGGAGSSTAGANTGSSGSAGSAGTTRDAGLAVEISGTWTGYVESYTFSDQSDAVTLNLSVAGSTVTGQATFGMSAAPPAPTDPSVGYPPGLALEPGGAGALGGPYPGFAFTIQNGTFSGDRLQFATSTTELWSAWCAAQTPIADEVNAGNYSCVHNWGITGGATCSQTDPMTQQIIPVDCTKYVLCQQVCACTAQACSAGSDQSVHFDLNIQLPRADGSATGLDSNVHNVHLTKG